MRRILLGIAAALALAAACTGASDPSEMARERGAIELLRAWPCADGTRRSCHTNCGRR